MTRRHVSAWSELIESVSLCLFPIHVHAAIRWTKKGGISVSLRFFPLTFSSIIEAMPAPLSSANILQEPPKQAGCAITTTGPSQWSAGAARTDRGGLRENKENLSGCDPHDLEKQRHPMKRIAVLSESTPGRSVNDVNHSLSRGDDKTY